MNADQFRLNTSQFRQITSLNSHRRNQQPLYVQSLFSRDNWIMKIWLSIIFALSSRPRMLLETPIRINMGERYFNLSSCLFLALVLATYPVYDALNTNHFRGDEGTFSLLKFLLHYLSWYVYLAVFLVSAFQRQEEVKRLPGVFDFKRFSISNGYIHPFFRTLKLNGKTHNRRNIEIWLEPGFFFIGGFLLWLLSQPLGMLLMVCSVFYSLSYKSAYQQGDDIIMNEIDKKIVNEELGKIIIEGCEAEETRGVTYMGHRPEDPEVRRQMVALLTGKTDMFTISKSSAPKPAIAQA